MQRLQEYDKRSTLSVKIKSALKNSSAVFLSLHSPSKLMFQDFRLKLTTLNKRRGEFNSTPRSTYSQSRVSLGVIGVADYGRKSSPGIWKMLSATITSS